VMETVELESAVSGLEEDGSPSRFCLVRAFMGGRCGLLWGICASAGALLRRLKVIGLLMRTASVMVLYSERGGDVGWSLAPFLSRVFVGVMEEVEFAIPWCWLSPELHCLRGRAVTTISLLKSR
jgi:hypothetical protein